MESMLIWGITLLGVALLLVIIEMFVPSAGVIAITALTVAIAGVVCLFKYDTVWGIIGSLGVIVGGPVLFFLGLQIMPNTPFGRRLVLRNPTQKDDDDAPANNANASMNQLQALIGREGQVLSDLRPIGTVSIANQRYDALAESTMIRAGAKIRVISIVDGTQLKVRELA